MNKIPTIYCILIFFMAGCFKTEKSVGDMNALIGLFFLNQANKCSLVDKQRLYADDKKYPTPYDNLVPSKFLYVSPDGNDSNPGSKEKPLKTIQASIGLSDPGTSISVMAGIYNEKISFENKKGLISAPIWLISSDGYEKATIQSLLRDTISGFGANHIIISGFKIFGGVFFGTTIQPPYTPETIDCKYIVVRKNSIRGSSDRALTAAACSNIYYLENHICDIGVNLFRSTSEGIDLVTVNDSIVARNTVYDGQGSLIVAKGGSTNILIAENLLFNTVKIAISAGQSTTESLMWTDALNGKYEGKQITVRENEILSSPFRQHAIQFSACDACVAEKNKITARRDYFADVILDESNFIHPSGVGWVTRNAILKNNCVERENWLFTASGVPEPIVNTNNNLTGCN